ncbi:MAG TPA: M24 family metallopeptidase [Trebonia sp.]|jgi:Xaa-Pro aminopeptidase|nr:M24 family metallopeptidase [Trebonia sp.]
MRDEDERARRLVAAQGRAVALFEEVGRRGLVAAGRREREVSDQIRDLANEMSGRTRHWHKRIIRSGPNTMRPYRENPPDRVIAPDDIAFADFGPIFEEFEADLGRTYVLGGDPDKLRLAADLPGVFAAGRRYFELHPDVTGEELHAEVGRLAAGAGWELGGWQAGHLVGEFPHEQADGEETESYVTPGNDTPMRRHDKAGNQCHWILEVHLTDPAGRFGGFYEQLLDLA